MFDIDGVLNEHGGNIMDCSKKAIQLLRDRNLRVCFASGKHAWYIQGGLVWSGLLEKDTVIVAENGGVVYDPNTRQKITEENHLADVRLLRNIFYNLYSRNNGYLQFASMRVWEEPKETLFCLFPQKPIDVKPLAKILKEIIELNQLKLYIVENLDSVDVLQLNVNKASGLKKANALMGVTSKEIIAFGDSYNDMEMLEVVGFAVTVNNGKKEIKEIVKNKRSKGYIAKQNYGDGVLEAVEYLIDQKLI